MGLYLGRATQGIDHTAELDEQPVTRRLDEPAMCAAIVGSISSVRMAFIA
jgi:hypothetical protein